ncbi:MAG: NAD-dependent epimerase/dehydratase family protein [Blastocatellia bacterium]|nr:NAD-dependent epimerase/dehydratase family protein [Blastocatellia bacterium]
MLVTGGTGFLGQHLARRLLALGHRVTVLGRNRTLGQELERAGVHFQPVEFHDAEAVITACRRQDFVFHCGALSAPWGKAADFHTANVLGTRHVITGCQTFGVHRLVHVSTPSIYFDFRDRENIAENEPLPTRAANEYARTKRLAETLVDEAHRAGLPVVTVRPRAIFGPGDTVIFPRLIKAFEQGRLKIIGTGRNLADVTYVDNVVDGLLLAAQAETHVLGKKYNLTNGEPAPLWDIITRLLAKLGFSFRPGYIPYAGALIAATVMETVARLIPNAPEPVLTRYSVGVLAKTQTLDITAARQELGYQPKISLETGLNRFAAWWKASRNS